MPRVGLCGAHRARPARRPDTKPLQPEPLPPHPPPHPPETKGSGAAVAPNPPPTPAHGAHPPLFITPGNIKQLEKTGAKQKAQGRIVLRTGLCNVNAWILTITYGMCFGVELTLNAVS